MSGQIIGDRYLVEKQLGKKSGRWTLLARDVKTQDPVILKLLFVDEETEWDDLKLFNREAETIRSLSHPSIPRYINHFEIDLPNDGKALALVQSFIEGKSLEQLLQEGHTLNETQAKQIARALLHILIYLHGQQPPVIHRDIKPSNVLLTPRQAFLVDFGSVKSFVTRESSAFTVVGTYGYMPPEQFSGRAIVASDLYSLGATLISAITGVHPSSLPRKGVRIDFEQLSPVNPISPTFADWLAWLTEHSLERRLKTAKDALEALEQEQTRDRVIQSIQKPAGSKISLTSSPEALEILIPSLLGQTSLCIDSQKITSNTKRMGLSASRPQVALRQDISKLEYAKPATSETTESHLTIWAGIQRFDVGSSSALSDAEMSWLAQELSNWLKLPVSSN
jgi:serine/threonine protein kinase